MKRKNEKMNQELAEIVALQALAYIAGEENYLNWLMSETGSGQDQLENAAENKEFLAGILDFLLVHEEILINFCESIGIDYTVPASARQQLPGAQFDTF